MSQFRWLRRAICFEIGITLKAGRNKNCLFPGGFPLQLDPILLPAGEYHIAAAVQKFLIKGDR